MFLCSRGFKLFRFVFTRKKVGVGIYSFFFFFFSFSFHFLLSSIHFSNQFFFWFSICVDYKLIFPMYASMDERVVWVCIHIYKHNIMLSRQVLTNAAHIHVHLYAPFKTFFWNNCRNSKMSVAISSIFSAYRRRSVRFTCMS